MSHGANSALPTGEMASKITKLWDRVYCFGVHRVVVEQRPRRMAVQAQILVYSMEAPHTRYWGCRLRTDLSAPPQAGRHQKRVCRARCRHDRDRDQNPEAGVSAALLLAADFAVVGGPGDPHLGLHERAPFLGYPPRIGPARLVVLRGRRAGRRALHETAGGHGPQARAHGLEVDPLPGAGERPGQPVGALGTLAQQVEDLEVEVRLSVVGVHTAIMPVWVSLHSLDCLPDLSYPPSEWQV